MEMSFLLGCVFCRSKAFCLFNKLNREVKPHYCLHLQLIMETWGSQKQMPGFLQGICGWRVEALELEAGPAFPLVLPFKKMDASMKGKSPVKNPWRWQTRGTVKEKIVPAASGSRYLLFKYYNFLLGCSCVSALS